MSKEVLDRHWEELRKKANVLNVSIANKFKDGQDTGTPAITVYVSKKTPAAELAPEHLIPAEIDGVPTDVVELAPTTWEAGDTPISRLHPEQQRRMLGLTPRSHPKLLSRVHPNLATPSGASDLIKWASDIQNQANCGSCSAFGNIGVMEATIRAVANDMNACPKLSEAHLFFCSGGTCDGGNTVDAVLNKLMKGICKEACLPYQDHDQACEAGICANWWLEAKRISAWHSITDPTEQKALLDIKPLNSIMAVHQSFFNYKGGVYKNLGSHDPIAGYHDIGCFGYSDAVPYKIIRNSWDIAWGENCVINGVARPGYCLIDPAELDPEMQELVPDGPVPEPGPPGPEPLRITSLSLPSGVVGQSYSGTLAASGGQPPYTWSLGDGYLPPGLTLNKDTGVIRGLPTDAGYTNVTFMCTDSAGAATGVNLWMTINWPEPSPTPTPPPPGPTPSPCAFGQGIARALNAGAHILGRKGRFHYLNPPRK